jgi:hypothetical protein
MFKILLSLFLSLLMVNPSWAYLTAGKIAVTATSSSSGVSSTSQDSDITDILGTSVTSGVVTYVPELCLNNVCESAWPSGGSQTTGSNLLFGNGSGGYTNVSGTSTNGTTITLANNIAANTINSTGINWTSIYNYGTSASAFTQSANLKIAFGTGLAYNGTVSNLPFTSSGSYVVTFAPVDISGYVTEFPSITQTSGSAFTIVGQTNITYNWMAIGY